MAHVSQAKKEIVKKLVDFINKYSVIGIVNMENLPTKQLQKMREQLRGKVVLIVAKRRLIKIAIDSIKDKLGIEQLKDNLVGMPGLLFTNENPFSLYKTLQKSKSSAPAKPGQKAPRSIVVQAGPTNFAPGPIIGELGSVGIKTSVEGGKLAIKEDKVVANEGDIISEKLAGILARLGIEPMEIGLDLVAAYENGTIYTKKILAIDEEEYKSNLAQAHRWAFNLAIETVIYTRDTITFMITKAFRDSKNLALEQNIIADLVAEEILTKAEVQAKMLSLETKFVTISKPQERKEIKEIKKEEITKESKEITENKEKDKEIKKEEITKESEKITEDKEKDKEIKKEEITKESKEIPKDVIEEAMRINKEVMIEQTKKNAKPEKSKIEEPELPKSAGQIIEEAMALNKKLAQEKKLKETTIQKHQPKKERIPTTEELLKRLQQKGTLKKSTNKVPTIAELAEAKKKKEQKKYNYNWRESKWNIYMQQCYFTKLEKISMKKTSKQSYRQHMCKLTTLV